MTIFKFQGSAHKEGGPIQYGKPLKINGAIQIFETRGDLVAGSIHFQHPNETGVFAEEQRKAYEEAMFKDNDPEPYITTIIVPESGSPVYNIVGEQINHQLEYTLPLSPYDAGDPLLKLPRSARK